MFDRTSAYRNDEELAAILDEPTDWKLTGRHGASLGYAETLRTGVQMARDIVRRGGWVVAMAREPRRDIVVFSAQIQKLEKAARSIPETIPQAGDCSAIG
jgi:hypothetical protein